MNKTTQKKNPFRTSLDVSKRYFFNPTCHIFSVFSSFFLLKYNLGGSYFEQLFIYQLGFILACISLAGHLALGEVAAEDWEPQQEQGQPPLQDCKAVSQSIPPSQESSEAGGCGGTSPGLLFPDLQGQVSG